jgi:hypothetical protein
LTVQVLASVKSAQPLMTLTFGLLQQPGHDAGQLPDDAVLPRHGLGQVDGGLAAT